MVLKDILIRSMPDGLAMSMETARPSSGEVVKVGGGIFSLKNEFELRPRRRKRPTAGEDTARASLHRQSLFSPPGGGSC